jgi:hypothetical protein
MTIPESLLEVCEYTGEGYKPIVDYGAWRVAILRHTPGSAPQNIPYIERHNETDEVFVLLTGRCTLYIGEGGDTLGQIHAVQMLPLKAYNVKKATWHACWLGPEAVVLIVENRDTVRENSSYINFTDEQKRKLASL